MGGSVVVFLVGSVVGATVGATVVVFGAGATVGAIVALPSGAGVVEFDGATVGAIVWFAVPVGAAVVVFSPVRLAEAEAKTIQRITALMDILQSLIMFVVDSRDEQVQYD